ncbi:flavin-containing monooxygenase [Aquihabitans sp. McL0605]|uniref:flavin-containing monooxygenase n=1 Tax=Aquihabitans sp. McL0605 TaxID=3415671 RepID=UPI003CEC8912
MPTPTTGRPPLGPIAALGRRLPPGARALAARLPGALAPPVDPGTRTPRVAIIGSGFGGIGMACRLRQAGIDTFTIYEKADAVGGTWRDNTYPGAACDVPSHLYSLSFAPKTDWTRKFPEQAEILAYLNEVTDRFGLRPHLRLGTELTAATWDEAEAQWQLTFADGSTDVADVVVAATGQLNRPQIPPIEGLDGFEGTVFHSARWDHEHDLTGDVAVIGIGASAIQFVPEVAKTARTLTLFQRSSNYVAPKPDGEFSQEAKARFRRIPGWQRLYRFSIWVRFDLRWAMFRQGSRIATLGEKRFSRELVKAVSDEVPAEVLIPDYRLGCKRILISNDWYPTLFQPNVKVITAPVDHVTPTGVRSGDADHAVDTIIFGTGFATTGFLAPIEITGRGGRNLHDEWREGAEAHLGLTVNGFPNLFLLYGPNTNLGHNSIIFMIERQVGYALTCIRRLVDQGEGSLEVTPAAQTRSNQRLERRLARTVWAESCHSWYKTETGRITNNWSGPTIDYWRRTRRPRAGDFQALPRPERDDELVGSSAHSGAGRSPE